MTMGRPRASVRGVVRIAQLVVGLALWAGYALPLFVPPPFELAPPPLHPTLSERLYPGVPPDWVVTRLGCLAAAILLLGPLLRDPFVATAAGEPAVGVTTGARRVVLGLAVALLVGSPWASALPHHWQQGFILALLLPCLILALDRARHGATAIRMGPLACSVLFVGVWWALAACSWWRSPWVTNPADALMIIDAMRRVASPDFDLLKGELLPSLTALHMVPAGAAIPGLESFLPQVAWVQGVNIFWLPVVALLLGRVAAHVVGPGAAFVALGVFLFSPWVMTMPLMLGMWFFGVMTVTSLLLLGRRALAAGSECAVVLGGLVVGSGLTHLATIPISIVSAAYFAWCLWRRGRASERSPARWAVVAATCLGLSAAIAASPSLGSLRSASTLYATGQQSWVGLDAAALGVVRPSRIEFHRDMGRSEAGDLPLSAVLTPVALPRTPIRVLGDVVFEPITVLLAALGAVACCRWHRHRWARALLVVLAVAILPGFVSTYDRPSITRMWILPVPIALLASVGMASLWRGLVGGAVRPVRGGALVATVAALSGLWLHEEILPRTIPRAGLATVLTEAAVPGLPRAALFVPRLDPFRWAEFAAQVPRRPFPAIVYDDARSLLDPSGRPAADLMFWSPGLEDDLGIGESICARWPKARRFALFDQTGTTPIFAALPLGGTWHPNAASSTWRELSCQESFETEASAGARALQAARDLLAQGDRRRAVETLRAAAERSFAHFELFLALSQSLLGAEPGLANCEEAVAWAHRAVQGTRSQNPEALDVEASALETCRAEGRASALRARAAALRSTPAPTFAARSEGSR